MFSEEVEYVPVVKSTEIHLMRCITILSHVVFETHASSRAPWGEHKAVNRFICRSVNTTCPSVLSAPFSGQWCNRHTFSWHYGQTSAVSVMPVPVMQLVIKIIVSLFDVNSIGVVCISYYFHIDCQ